MKERPILFSGPMVRAILDGRKTQMRRPWKEYPAAHHPCPIGEKGDRLWVRETWRMDPWNIAAEYRSTTSAMLEHIAPWRPSIHMPRWASRITLEIVRVWVERVRDITEEDAKAEAPDMFLKATGLCTEDPRMYMLKEGAWGSAFRDLWQSTYATWDANPWVWAVEFRRAKP